MLLVTCDRLIPVEVVVVFSQFVSALILLVTCDCRIAETVEVVVVFFQFVKFRKIEKQKIQKLKKIKTEFLMFISIFGIVCSIWVFCNLRRVARSRRRSGWRPAGPLRPEGPNSWREAPASFFFVICQIYDFRNYWFSRLSSSSTNSNF